MIDNYGDVPGDMIYSNSDVIARLIHAYIKLSIFDGEESSNGLSAAVIAIQSATNTLRKTIGETENADVDKALKQIESNVQESVVSLQFFDRVAQRMMHATHCLKILESVTLSSNLDDNFDLNSIYSILTMDDERKVFASIIQGDSIKSALQKAKHALKETVDSKDDNIELF